MSNIKKTSFDFSGKPVKKTEPWKASWKHQLPNAAHVVFFSKHFSNFLKLLNMHTPKQALKLQWDVVHWSCSGKNISHFYVFFLQIFRSKLCNFSSTSEDWLALLRCGSLWNVVSGCWGPISASRVGTECIIYKFILYIKQCVFASCVVL